MIIVIQSLIFRKQPEFLACETSDNKRSHTKSHELDLISNDNISRMLQVCYSARRYNIIY